MARGEKVAGWALLSWWLILLVGAGLGGNAYLVFRFFKDGFVFPGLLFCLFFVGACVYLWRTYRARDDIRRLLK
jgi:hypothetical protein